MYFLNNQFFNRDPFTEHHTSQLQIYKPKNKFNAIVVYNEWVFLYYIWSTTDGNLQYEESNMVRIGWQPKILLIKIFLSKICWHFHNENEKPLTLCLQSTLLTTNKKPIKRLTGELECWVVHFRADETDLTSVRNHSSTHIPSTWKLR